jgi:FimV-like protein
MNLNKIRRRLFVILITILFGLTPQIAFSLGFGQIRLFSYLNEPLDAEIELLGAEDEDPTRLIASLASAEEFKRADISRPYFLSKLRFEVQQRKKNFVIKVTSDDLVKQPYLEFIVILSWAQGRIMRGYTLLLDPAPMGGASKRELDLPLPAGPQRDKNAIKKMQEKISKNLTLAKPVRVAKTEGLITDIPNGEGFSAYQMSPKEVIGQNLENLFEPEPEPKSEALTFQLQKAPSVSIDSTQEVDSSQESEPNSAGDEAIFTEKSENKATDENNDIETKNSLDNVKTKWMTGLYENKILLGSGLALMFSIALSVWFLKRARQTLPIMVSSSNGIEIFDEDIAVKLDLANQYLGICDYQSAAEILNEVALRGNHQEIENAKTLLSKIPTTPQ